MPASRSPSKVRAESIGRLHARADGGDLAELLIELEETTYTLWMMANHKPKVKFDDDAVWERIIQLAFPNTIPAAERDPFLKSRLMDPDESGSAILAWAVHGLADYLERGGLDVPEAVVAAGTAWRTEMDPLRPFLEECCVKTTGASIDYGVLWTAYQQWGNVNRVAAWDLLTKAKMTPRLKERYTPQMSGANGDGKTVKGWIGLALADTRV